MIKLPQVYLASSSPRRQELLQQMGVLFQVVSQDVAETHQAGETAEQFVLRLAQEKAQDGLKYTDIKEIPVLGSDTAVVIENTILGKPENKQHAIEMLLHLSGQTHQVMTAVALVNHQKSLTSVSVSEVTFSKLTREICEHYWQTGEPSDKAGAYAVQGKGALFIKNINGSYSGVMGLPVFETAQLLNKFKIPLL